MKRHYLIATSLALLFAANVDAQLKKDTKGYSRLELSFATQNISEYTPAKVPNSSSKDPEYYDSYSNDIYTKGAACGLILGFSLSQTNPIFLELGGRVGWNRQIHEKLDNEGTKKLTYKYTFLNFSVPLQLAYKFSFEESDISITPYFGPNLKVNIIGKNSFEQKPIAGGKTETVNTLYFDEYKDDRKTNDDVGCDGKRFQLGLNLGFNVRFHRFGFGATYQPDLMPYYKYSPKNSGDYSARTSNLLASFSINF